MTQPQPSQKYIQLELPLNPNQHLIDMGFTQDEIDYAFDCARVYPKPETSTSIYMDIGVPDSGAEKKV